MTQGSSSCPKVLFRPPYLCFLRRLATLRHVTTLNYISLLELCSRINQTGFCAPAKNINLPSPS